jgi:hypothetical protein
MLAGQIAQRGSEPGLVRSGQGAAGIGQPDADRFGRGVDTHGTVPGPAKGLDDRHAGRPTGTGDHDHLGGKGV